LTPTRAPRSGPALALLALAVAGFVAVGGLVRGDDPGAKSGPPARSARALTDDEAEAAALAFVRENHPELAALLAQLKPMKPEEYRRAVRELAQVSRSLAETKTSNPKRYELALDSWKAKSRVELLAARLASASGPSPELESQLRQAVEAQIDAEVRTLRFDKAAIEERLRRLNETLDRLETRRDSVVETRVQNLLKKSERSRRQAAKASRPVADSKVKTNAKTNPAAGAVVGADVTPNSGSGADGPAAGAGKSTSTSKGERQP
jgi:hypothetical protein